MTIKLLWKNITFLIILILLLISCSTTRTTFPIVYTHSTNTEFEILGTVFYKSSTSVGYNTIFEEARKQYPATDFVIDIMIDKQEIVTSYHFIAKAFRLLFTINMKQKDTKYEYMIRGTAIKYIRRNIDGEIITTSTPTFTSISDSLNIFGSVAGSTGSDAQNNSNVQKITPSIAANTRFAVVSVNGNVRRVTGRKGINPVILTSNVLRTNTRIMVGYSSSLILSDGKNNFTINGPITGRIIDII